MKLAISNIVWDKPEDEGVSEILQSLGVKGIEVAPSKIWPAPLEASESSIQAYRDWWESRGISIIGMQALLYNKPELTLFESKERRQNTFEYLSQLIRLAAQLGVEAMVFGSPKNRLLGSLEKSQADSIAQDFFGKLGEVALSHGTKFCVEPNPSDYGGDYLNTVLEAIALVRKVDHSGFRLHLDAGGMIMNSEVLTIESGLLVDEIAHFHISEPFLKEPENYPEYHKKYAAFLSDLGYSSWVSVEMQAPDLVSRRETIKKILNNAIKWYQK